MRSWVGVTDFRAKARDDEARFLETEQALRRADTKMDPCMGTSADKFASKILVANKQRASSHHLPTERFSTNEFLEAC